jgi:hypothetical protein
MKLRTFLYVSALCLSLGSAQAQEQHAHHEQGSASDSRAVLELTPAERALILEEMRMFLAGVQQMTGALGRQDMPAAAESARSMGRKMVHEVPPALRAKLPQDFRQLGFSVHSEFDQIALDADSLKDASHSLNQLSVTLQKCVACHAAYQIRISGSDNRH